MTEVEKITTEECGKYHTIEEAYLHGMIRMNEIWMAAINETDNDDTASQYSRIAKILAIIAQKFVIK